MYEIPVPAQEVSSKVDCRSVIDMSGNKVIESSLGTKI